MKTRHQLLIFGLLGFSLLSISATKVDKMDNSTQMLKSQLEAKNYRIDVDRALPVGMRDVTLTTIYSVKVVGDSIFSDLPYYGRAYSVPYGGGDGLRFNSPMTDYKQVDGRKGSTEITFKTRSKEDTHDFRITIYSDGTSNVTVNSINRQSISYRGKYVTTLKQTK